MTDDNLIFDEDVEGDVKPEPTDKPTEEPVDKPTDEPTEDEPIDEPEIDDLEELDDETLMRHLAKKGIETDSFGKISAALKDLPSLQKKHQSKVADMKAVRAKLEAQGIDPDDFFRESRDVYDGKPSKKVPESMQKYKPEQVEALGKIVNHFIKQDQAGFIDDIVKAVREDTAFGSFADSVSENRDELQAKLNEVAEQHGITGRGKDTLKLLYKISQGDLKDAVENLNGDDGPHANKPAGRPNPQGKSRNITKAKTEGLTDEQWRKRGEALNRKAGKS